MLDRGTLQVLIDRRLLAPGVHFLMAPKDGDDHSCMWEPSSHWRGTPALTLDIYSLFISFTLVTVVIPAEAYHRLFSD